MKFLLSLVLVLVAYFVGCFAEFDCEVDGHKFNKGYKLSPAGRCELVECRGKDEISVLPCGFIIPPPNCKLTPVDYTKPYPRCCPSFVC